MKRLERVALAQIKLARKLFYNTPVQKWPLTTYIYDKVFHLGYSRGDLSTTYFGALLTFPGRDLTITPGLVGGFYERYEIQLFQDICKVSKRIVDVGANIGLYAVIAGKAGCNVIAFEPVTENFKYLGINITQNGLDKKIKAIKKAVSSQNGIADIFLSQKQIGTHSLSASSADSNYSVKVDVVTLDTSINYKKSKVDVLKIDVEGYDGFVLEGAQKLITTCHPTLFIEMVPHRLLAAGYKPASFVDLIYKRYKKVYVIDDVNGMFSKASKKMLLDLIKRDNDVNLVAVEQVVHMRVLESARR